MRWATTVEFEDSFQDGRSGWAADNEWGTFRVRNGAFEVIAKQAGGVVYQVPFVEPRDYEFEALVGWQGGIEFGFGIGFGRLDTNGGWSVALSFLITALGHWTVLAGKTEVAPWTSDAVVRRGALTNHLKIERVEDVLRFWLNGAMVLQTSRSVFGLAPFDRFVPALTTGQTSLRVLHVRLGRGLNVLAFFKDVMTKYVEATVEGMVQEPYKAFQKQLASLEAQLRVLQLGDRVEAAHADQPSTAEVPAADKPEQPELTVLSEVDQLVGMDNVKLELKGLVKYLRVQKLRETAGLATTPLSLHMVFHGPPGTGKTTVARLIGRIYKELGLLDSGHVIETDRSKLVAGYVGQTAIRVDETVTKALGGVLFVDEAYALAPDGIQGADFGREAIDTLLKKMEDHRENLAVIVAGYRDEMDRFLEANPGLRSRFNRFFEFTDYRPSELRDIFQRFCADQNYRLTKEAEKKLIDVLTKAYARRTNRFGNGRYVRNLFERAIQAQCSRLAAVASPTMDELILLHEDDIARAVAV